MILRIARSLAAKMSVLHVAEKNSIAKQVANVLSRSSRRNIPSISKYNPIYEFDLQNKPHRFTSVRGHIFEYELPEQCKNWKSFDNKKILLSQVPMIKKLGPDMDDVANNISRLARDHKQLVLWLDCDREGQAIAFEVIELCLKANPKITIKRARFSAVTPTDVWNAYNGLVNPNKRQADAVNYRIEIDFRSGCSFTRFQTTTFQSMFQLQSGSFLSYGPCQMPTLSFIVQRYLQIKNFKPQKYWFIQMTCIIDENTGIPFTWQKKNTRSQHDANLTVYKILSPFPDGNVIGKVTDRKKNDKKKYRPYPLTTVKFQKLATDKLRLSSAKAMQIAQKLYQKGLISYPRTQTNAFPKTMNLKNLIQRLQNSHEFGPYINKLLQQGKYTPPKSGTSNDEAHTPIHPVKLVDRKSLDPDEWRVYDLIVRSFLACCSADAIGVEFQVKANVSGQAFKASYLTIKEHNFLQIYPFQKWVETSFPADIPNEFLAKINLKQSKTTPPGYMTESQLIDMMQKNQIGTDSTIHEHIENVQKRKYAVKNNNTLKPTNLGASLVQSYHQLGISLPQCEIRRKIQQKMNRIADGQITQEVATRQTLQQMLPIYEKLVNIKQDWLKSMKKYMDSNSDLKKIQVQQKSEVQQQNQNKKTSFIKVCKCPKCNQGDGVVRYSQRNSSYFIGCSKFPACKWTQSLPPYIGQVKQTNKQCTRCRSNMVEITAKQGKVIQNMYIKLNFQQSQTGSIEVCLSPGCNEQIYDFTQQYNNNNTNSNTQPNMNRNNSSDNPNSNNSNNYSSFANNNNNNNNSRSNFANKFDKYQKNSSSTWKQNDQSSGSKTKYNNYNNKKGGTSTYKSNSTGNYTNNNNKSNNTSTQNKRQIICYRCNEPGHIAPNCPNKGTGSINSKINQFKSGFPAERNNYNNKKTDKKNQDDQGKKVCKQCGIEGRHPRGSQCPSVVRKRKPKQ